MYPIHNAWFDFWRNAWSQTVRHSYESFRQLAGNSAYDELPQHYRSQQIVVPLSSIKVGDEATATVKIEKWMLLYFAASSGDWNPAHMHKDGAPPFNEPIAHGELTCSFISALYANQLPGPGSIFVSNAHEFKRPVKIGDEITGTVRVTAIDYEAGKITLVSHAMNQHGKTVIEGRAVLMRK